jgi:hypothetical protein
MLHFLLILFFNPFGILGTEDDNVITIEKKIKIHHTKHSKVVRYKIDTCTFYFDAHHFMLESSHINEGKHKFHEPILKDLTLLLVHQDTVDLSYHKYKAEVSSLVNDALEKGYVELYFSGKPYHGKTILNIEYWDKDVHTHEHKHSNFYRPDSDIFMLIDEGEIFYYYKPAIKRAEHKFRE